jgi:hypothetical protein
MLTTAKRKIPLPSSGAKLLAVATVRFPSPAHFFSGSCRVVSPLRVLGRDCGRLWGAPRRVTRSLFQDEVCDGK